MRIKIVADSACDLPLDLLQRYDIAVLPLHIYKGKEVFLDMTEITPADIFAYGEETGRLCSTAAVNVVEFSAAFIQYRAEHDAVVCINIAHNFHPVTKMLSLQRQIPAFC